MRCEQVRVRINPYLFDEISDGERQSLEAHLETCGHCLRALEKERDYVRTLTLKMRAAVQGTES